MTLLIKILDLNRFILDSSKFLKLRNGDEDPVDLENG